MPPTTWKVGAVSCPRNPVGIPPRSRRRVRVVHLRRDGPALADCWSEAGVGGRRAKAAARAAVTVGVDSGGEEMDVADVVSVVIAVISATVAVLGLVGSARARKTAERAANV